MTYVPFHPIQHVLKLFVEHEDLVSEDSDTVAILEGEFPHVRHTWHRKLLMAQDITNCQNKIRCQPVIGMVSWLISWLAA